MLDLPLLTKNQIKERKLKENFLHKMYSHKEEVSIWKKKQGKICNQLLLSFLNNLEPLTNLSVPREAKRNGKSLFAFIGEYWKILEPFLSNMIIIDVQSFESNIKINDKELFDYKLKLMNSVYSNDLKSIENICNEIGFLFSDNEKQCIKIILTRNSKNSIISIPIMKKIDYNTKSLTKYTRPDMNLLSNWICEFSERKEKIFLPPIIDLINFCKIEF